VKNARVTNPNMGFAFQLLRYQKRVIYVNLVQMLMLFLQVLIMF